MCVCKAHQGCLRTQGSDRDQNSMLRSGQWGQYLLWKAQQHALWSQGPTQAIVSTSIGGASGIVKVGLWIIGQSCEKCISRGRNVTRISEDPPHGNGGSTSLQNGGRFRNRAVNVTTQRPPAMVPVQVVKSKDLRCWYVSHCLVCQLWG